MMPRSSSCPSRESASLGTLARGTASPAAFFQLSQIFVTRLRVLTHFFSTVRDESYSSYVVLGVVRVTRDDSYSYIHVHSST